LVKLLFIQNSLVAGVTFEFQIKFLKRWRSIGQFPSMKIAPVCPQAMGRPRYRRFRIVSLAQRADEATEEFNDQIRGQSGVVFQASNIAGEMARVTAVIIGRAWLPIAFTGQVIAKIALRFKYRLRRIRRGRQCNPVFLERIKKK
jgi:hypothetical protein